SPPRAYRTGCATDPFEGGRRVFRDAEPARYTGNRAGAAWQPNPACAARLHAEGTEGGADGSGYVPSQSGFRQLRNDHAARHGRSAGVDPGGQGHSVYRAANIDPPAILPAWPADGCRTTEDHR